MDLPNDTSKLRLLNNLEELKIENVRLARELRKLQLLQMPPAQDENEKTVAVLAEVETADLEKERLISELRSRLDILTAENKRLQIGGESVRVERGNSSVRWSAKKLTELENMVRARQQVIDKTQEEAGILKAEIVALRQELKAVNVQFKNAEFAFHALEVKGNFLAEKVKLSEITNELLVRLIRESSVLGELSCGGTKIAGVGFAGMFLLAESNREIEKVFGNKEYEVEGTGDGFILTSLAGNGETVSFSVLGGDGVLKVNFWIECLRLSGFTFKKKN